RSPPRLKSESRIAIFPHLDSMTTGKHECSHGQTPFSQSRPDPVTLPPVNEDIHQQYIATPKNPDRWITKILEVFHEAIMQRLEEPRKRRGPFFAASPKPCAAARLRQLEQLAASYSDLAS